MQGLSNNLHIKHCVSLRALQLDVSQNPQRGLDCLRRRVTLLSAYTLYKSFVFVTKDNQGLNSQLNTA